jgi:hypothetical protein
LIGGGGGGASTPNVAYSCASAETDFWLNSSESRNVELLPN